MTTETNIPINPGRFSKRAKIGFGVGAGFLALAAIGSVLPEEESAVSTVASAPAETSAARPPATTEAPPTATVASTTTEPALPEWMTDGDVLAWSEQTSDVFNQVADLSLQAAEEMGDADINAATDTSIAIWLVLSAADRPPSNHPVAPQFNDWLDASIEAWDVISDALIDEDVDELEVGFDLLLIANEKMAPLLEAFEDATAAIEAAS